MTRPVRALTPHKAPLEEREPQAALGQRRGQVLTRRAAAEDYHLKVSSHRVTAHFGLAEPVAGTTVAVRPSRRFRATPW